MIANLSISDVFSCPSYVSVLKGDYLDGKNLN